MRGVLATEWVPTALWCLYVLWKINLGLAYQIGFCAFAVAVLVYAFKAQAWRFLTFTSAVAFFGSFWGLLRE